MLLLISLSRFKFISVSEGILEVLLAWLEENDDVSAEIPNASSKEYKEWAIEENEDDEEHYQWNIDESLYFS